MKMKIVAFVVVLLAAISSVMARDHYHHHRHVHGPAPAPGPSSDAASPGSILGVSLFSFVAYYLCNHA
ncbi:transmembrane protein, putative [Medicago truncatula]|uniref:Transmembrane protein, putative n=1 Tax=Medicago truncatula TaxID=3880 RepID=G7K7Y7_MEDTR|nr:transmembrane protein, putative [Medicago truncatula]